MADFDGDALEADGLVVRLDINAHSTADADRAMAALGRIATSFAADGMVCALLVHPHALVACDHTEVEYEDEGDDG